MSIGGQAPRSLFSAGPELVAAQYDFFFKERKETSQMLKNVLFTTI